MSHAPADGRATTSADHPILALFFPDQATASTPALIICPGGGYQHLAFDHEGVTVARWFKKQGIAALVLKYRLPADGYRHPVPLMDAQRALRLVRSHAVDWNLDPARIGIMGFSAGGHLASTLATHFDAGDPVAVDEIDRQSSRPDFAVLVYPVITLTGSAAHGGSRDNLLGANPDPALIENLSNQTQVTAQTPPTLLVHATDDDSVPLANSEMMLAALQKAGVTASLQTYAQGGHGFGFESTDPNRKAPDGWLDRVYAWLQEQKFV